MTLLHDRADVTVGYYILYKFDTFKEQRQQVIQVYSKHDMPKINNI
jgi:hypothetical protein